MSGVIITRGMGKPTYCTDSRSHRLIVVSSWWGIWEACSVVGVSVPKILSLDIRVCAVATFSR